MTALNPRKPTKAEILAELAERTGLHRDTVKDLMKKGWTYNESIDEPASFIHPLAQMRRQS